MRPQGEVKPDNLAGIWSMIRRVPSEFSEADRWSLVRVSTNIAVRDDPRRGIRAKNVVKQLSRELEAYWRGVRDGQSADYEVAQKRAEGEGAFPAGIGTKPGQVCPSWTPANERVLFAYQAFSRRFDIKTADAHLAAIRDFERFHGGEAFSAITIVNASSYRDHLIARRSADSANWIVEAN